MQVFLIAPQRIAAQVGTPVAVTVEMFGGWLLYSAELQIGWNPALVDFAIARQCEIVGLATWSQSEVNALGVHIAVLTAAATDEAEDRSVIPVPGPLTLATLTITPLAPGETALRVTLARLNGERHEGRAAIVAITA